MDNTLPSSDLEVKESGLAIECGTLTVLLDALVHQPVLVMPLARTSTVGLLLAHQRIIHVTARRQADCPVVYATMRAAEVVQTATATTLTYPYQQRGSGVMQRAQQLQQQLLTCVRELLAHAPQVHHVMTPARFRLPDAWVWSAQCTEERIVYRHDAWTLVGHQLPAEAGSLSLTRRWRQEAG